MLDDSGLLHVAIEGFRRLDYLYTFLLLLCRFTGMFIFIPGLGGQQATTTKYPAIVVLSVAAITTSPVVPPPNTFGDLLIAVVAEVLLGSLLGIMPQFVVAGAQMAGQLASTSMGLNAQGLFDPTTGTQQTDMSIIYGNLVTLSFLLLGGHHAVIYAVSGMGGVIVPGSFILGAQTIEVVVDQAAAIFSAGMLISAPVIVALLLTQFVMGLISKAVPTVNIFIVSFPLTIGIGLIISILALPDFMVLVQRQLAGMGRMFEIVVSSTTHVP